jgi:hypothetical protein
MSTPPVPLPPPRKPINLTWITTVLSLIFTLAFGICSISGISLSKGGDPQSTELLIVTAGVIGGICAAGLAAVAIIAFVRSRRAKQS